MATHSRTLAWRIPWRKEPGRLQSMGSQRVGQNWETSLSLSIPFKWVPPLWADYLPRSPTPKIITVLREKEMATHSSILAWKIPQTKEPGRLQSMGSQRVGQDWATSLHFTSLQVVIVHWWTVDLVLSDETKCVREAIPLENQRLLTLQLIVKDRQVLL